MRDASGHEHEPAGTPIGGQFASSKSPGKAFTDAEKKALQDYEKINESLAFVTLSGVAPGKQDELAGVANDISKQTGAEFINPGTKTAESTQRKLSTGRTVGSLTDVVRGGFVVDTPDQADAVVSALNKRFPGALDEGWFNTNVGYFDRKVIVTFKGGVRGEVQIWQSEMFKAKELYGGHKLYEQARVLKKDDPKLVQLENAARKLYGRARAKLSPAWNAIAGSAGS